MRKETLSYLSAGIFLLYSLASLPAEERIIRLGGSEGWESFYSGQQIELHPSVRRKPALSIASSLSNNDPFLDLALSFDEDDPARYHDAVGHYSVTAASSIAAAGIHNARHGDGAIMFSGLASYGGLVSVKNEESLRILPGKGSLFSAGQRLDDFSIEFWLYPANMENGEQVFSWTAGRQTATGKQTFQLIRCQVNRNNLEWNFSELFSSPDDSNQIPVQLRSVSSILPRTWSHHLVRFDSEYGILEYLVDGKLESLVHTTPDGREGGDVYTPVMGEEGFMILGGRFTGMMDELRIYRRYLETPLIHKYPLEGGRFESRPIDLGSVHGEILRLEAEGDFTAGSADSGAAVQFFLRSADTPYRWTDDETEWTPVQTGKDLGSLFRGRWIQVAAHLYPSGDGEKTPYVDEIRIIHEPDTPPAPPQRLSAVSGDGSVQLSWQASVDADVGGYMVYYGEASGTYFGSDASLGASPLDVGLRTSIHIDGLQNGRLYYFCIAAYKHTDPRHEGDFSREVSARPLRMVQ